jgi:hypothetical protein
MTTPLSFIFSPLLTERELPVLVLVLALLVACLFWANAIEAEISKTLTTSVAEATVLNLLNAI